MAVDPNKAAAEEPSPEVDETPADESSTPAEPKDEGQPEPSPEPAYVLELRTKLDRAERAANEAREFARRAQGTSDRAAKNLEKEVSKLQKTLEGALTANMTPEEKAQFERDRRLERLEAERLETVEKPQNGDDPALREWQSFASRALEKVGYKHDDPRIVAAFQEANEGSTNPQDWPIALAAAIAKVGRGETEKARTDAQRTADTEKVKERNKQRQSEGKIDRSSPSGSARVRVDDMTDEEFDKHWEAQKTAAARREAGVGR